MKRYRIAGLSVDMTASGRTELQAQPYLAPVEGPADITIECDACRVLALNPQLPDEESAVYMGTGAMFARELLGFDGAYLHASAVILDGKAYLFSADSGVGKSTHTEKWCRMFGAVCLNDDKPALRLENGVWMAYGTPWSGKHDLSVPTGAPVGGIAFIRRGQENKIRPMAPAEAVPLFLNQTMWRLERDQMDKLLTLLDKLMQDVPLWELTCRNEDAAALVSRDAMTAKV